MNKKLVILIVTLIVVLLGAGGLYMNYVNNLEEPNVTIELDGGFTSIEGTLNIKEFGGSVSYETSTVALYDGEDLVQELVLSDLMNNFIFEELKYSKTYTVKVELDYHFNLVSKLYESDYKRDVTTVLNKEWSSMTNKNNNFMHVNVLNLSDGSVVLYGNKGTNKLAGFVEKYNRNGELVWEKDIQGNNEINLRSIFEGENNNVYVYCAERSSQGYFRYIIEFDQDGNEVSGVSGDDWADGEFKYSVTQGNMSKTKEGYVIALMKRNQDINVVQLDSNFNYVRHDLAFSRRTLPSGTNGELSFKAIEFGDDILVYSLYSWSNYNTDYRLIKMTKTGDVLWTKDFESEYVTSLKDMIVYNGDLYALGLNGTAYDSGVGTITLSLKSFLMKMNQAGEVEWVNDFKDESGIFAQGLTFNGQDSFYVIGSRPGTSGALGTIWTFNMSGQQKGRLPIDEGYYYSIAFHKEGLSLSYKEEGTSNYKVELYK